MTDSMRGWIGDTWVWDTPGTGLYSERFQIAAAPGFAAVNRWHRDVVRMAAALVVAYAGIGAFAMLLTLAQRR